MLWKKVIAVVFAICVAPFMVAQGASNGLLKRLPDEVMPAEYLRFKVDPVQRAQSQSFHRDRTAPDWRQAMPIGNGDFGLRCTAIPTT